MEQSLMGRLMQYKDAIACALLAALSLILHALPFLRGGAHPLGYDTGFYRRYLIEPFASFPNAPVPGLGDDALVPRLVLDLLRLTGIPTDVILYGTHLLFFALVPLIVFALLKTHAGFRAALLCAVLIVLSSVQYVAFWFFLWKNGFALCLLFLAFICIDRRYLYPLLALDVAIALSHKTTAIIYLATLGIFFLIDRTRRKDAVIHALVTLACFLPLNFPDLNAALVVRPQAIFIDWIMFIQLTLPFMLIIASAPLFFRELRLPRIVLAFGIVSILFPILHLPFFERIFVFSDIALAIVAGCALAYGISKLDFETLGWRTIVPLIIMSIGVGFLLANVRSQVRSYGPHLEAPYIEKIATLAKLVPRGTTILTTSEEAPWFEGFTQAHVAAPGMLHDNHNLEEWVHFWSTESPEEKIAFLAELPHPLYISTLGELSHLLGSTTIPCIEPVTEHLYLDACSRTP